MDYNTLNKKELIEIIKKLEKENNSYKNSKEFFLSNISHDVRTLLNIIFGNAQILENDETLNLNQKKSINKIIKSTSHIIDLINNIITTTKVNGEEKVILSEFKLLDLIEDIYSIFKNEAFNKNLSFKLETTINSDYLIKTDKNKLFYVLLNLVGNAIKYTNEGYVVLKCNVNEENIMFEVQDSGIGISSSKLKDITKEYIRGDNSLGQDGFGLGLGIVEKNLILLNSKLNIESRLNEGSIFSFKIKSKVNSKIFITTEDDIFDIKEIDYIESGEEFSIFLYSQNEEKITILENYFNSRSINNIIIRSFSDLITKSYLGNSMVFLDFNLIKKEDYYYIDKLKSENKNCTFVALSSSVLNDDLEKISKISSTYIVEPFNFIDIDQVLIMFSNQTFIYKKDSELINVSEIKINKNLKDDIIKASNLGDYKSCLNLIFEIKEENLKDSLNNYLESYDFDKIVSVLSKEE